MSYAEDKVVWDEAKHWINRQKHGVSFNEAKRLLLSNVERLEIFDVEHSVDEERFVIMGPTLNGVLVVVVTEPEDHVVRVISARRATRRERLFFGAMMRNR